MRRSARTEEDREKAEKAGGQSAGTGPADQFWRVLPEMKNEMGDLLIIPNYNPRRKLHASDPGYRSGKPRRCGRRGLIDLLEEGIDTTRQDITQCEAGLEDSRRSQVLVNQLLEELRQTRR